MRVYAGIDLHSSNSFTGVLDEKGHRLTEARVKNDLDQLETVIAGFREDLVGVVVESTYNWYWLVDGLMGRGYRFVNQSAFKIDPPSASKNDPPKVKKHGRGAARKGMLIRLLRSLASQGTPGLSFVVGRLRNKTHDNTREATILLFPPVFLVKPT